jgi:hydrogenase maturation protein HypF
MKNIVAIGAENKTTFSVISEKGLYTSDQINDLTDINSYNKHETELKKYLSDNSIDPDVMVCDEHPDYTSRTIAEKINKDTGAKILKVQHHHAHIAACMLDNNIDEKVVGISFDGTGYGLDGNSWGSEFMICDRRDFERRYHLKYVPVPGGDIAAKETWRMAVSYLYDAFGPELTEQEVPFLRKIEKEKIDLILQMIDKKVNSPLTSSMGRLFDAVSALLEICTFAETEAEGAILLEKEIDHSNGDHYEYSILKEEIDVAPMIRQIVGDIKNKKNKGTISAKFHNTIGEIVFDLSERLNKETGIDKVLISGGCFQNKYLTSYIEDKFNDKNLKLFKHKNFLPTDFNVSIGQAVIADNFYNKR